jgi:hypothetical protein
MMKPKLRWIVARLGHDENWWVEETSDEVNWGQESLSLLDPRQVAWLHEQLTKYEAYGLDPELFARSFHLFEASAELPDGRVRLVASNQAVGDDEGARLYALPDLFEDETDAYPEFLDQLAAARIKFLNDTHHYVHDVDELDMEEELQAKNSDRYFSARSIHIYNELEEILKWKPAEWDDAEEEQLAKEGGDEEEREEE